MTETQRNEEKEEEDKKRKEKAEQEHNVRQRDNEVSLSNDGARGLSRVSILIDVHAHNRDSWPVSAFLRCIQCRSKVSLLCEYI